jgi:hypothetical protein
VPSTVDDDDMIDVVTSDDDNETVQTIVTELQNTIENGNAGKSMIQTIMMHVERLRQIQQRHQLIWENSNAGEDTDNDKLILMKNPKKRSSNINANNKGLGKKSLSTAVSTPKKAIMPSFSTLSSMIMQRIISFQSTSKEKQSNDGDDDVSYRLLWVGSDDTISSFGTALHKVPLARLQEVFLSLTFPKHTSKTNKNKNGSNFSITTTEVIRILGPFPNIKNTLQGTCTISNTNTATSKEVNQKMEQWDISWDSMIDGTGKELISGSPGTERKVPTLTMLYGDAQILVASLTSSSTTGTDPFVVSPESVLIFVREMEMDDKLIALRVL